MTQQIAPEPATLAPHTLGVGGVGLMNRRKQKPSAV
ncbi:MAG: PEP-CTERM sorting domain-containing protein [Proteobacteria bacterium]|nr:PEP-CTERM sorting domain-containing protein [Pseudomonadota bacterium]